MVKDFLGWGLRRGRGLVIGWPVGGFTNERYLEGALRGCPMPLEGGSYAPLTRWLLIRDGLENLITALPKTEKGTAARLQEAWALASRRVEDLERERPPEWVLPL